MDNVTGNRTLKLAREPNKANYLPPLAQIGRLKAVGVAVGLLAFSVNSAPPPALCLGVKQNHLMYPGQTARCLGGGLCLQKDAVVLTPHNSAAPEAHTPTLLRSEITLGFYSSHL